MAVPDPPASTAPAAGATPATGAAPVPAAGATPAAGAAPVPAAGAVPHRATAGPAASNSAIVTADTAPYVTRPTRWTIFLRTFVPWQLWRFARINLKMIRIIRRSGG
jgi:hypothetical protein